jgi:hypothetical protein
MPKHFWTPEEDKCLIYCYEELLMSFNRCAEYMNKNLISFRWYTKNSCLGRYSRLKYNQKIDKDSC